MTLLSHAKPNAYYICKKRIFGIMSLSTTKENHSIGKIIIFVKTGRNYHLMSTAMVPLGLH